MLYFFSIISLVTSNNNIRLLPALPSLRRRRSKPY